VRRRRAWALAACAALALLAAARAFADESEEARLRARLGPELAPQVIEIVREAAADSLPTASLVARALEGASRQADAGAILAAVRRQAAGLAAARRVLGPVAREAELEAGAGALLAGVPEDSLASLKRARPTGSLVIPLVVLSDFVARGVPAANASSTVLSATRAGAPDPALLRMRERINERIQRGEKPAGASREGLRELLLTTSPGRDGGATRKGTP
jgi:hypothetical protein